MKIVTNPSWKIAVVFRKSVSSDEHDLGRCHRQEDEHVRRSAPDEMVPDDRHGDERAERRRHDGRHETDLERRDDRVLNPEHCVPVDPVVERELLPHVVEPARRLVEREEDHDGDREHQVPHGEERIHRQRMALDEPPHTCRGTRSGTRWRDSDRRHPVSLSDPTTRA
jgi:hypothetical protein